MALEQRIDSAAKKFGPEMYDAMLRGSRGSRGDRPLGAAPEVQGIFQDTREMIEGLTEELEDKRYELEMLQRDAVNTARDRVRCSQRMHFELAA